MSETQPVIKWSYLTRDRIGRASPAIAEDGSVYVGDNENYFYTISCEGKLIWRHKVSGRLGDPTSSITDDGTVLITTETGRLPEADGPRSNCLCSRQFNPGDHAGRCRPARAHDGDGTFRPSVFNREVGRKVAEAVIKVTVETGVAGRERLVAGKDQATG